MIAVNNNSIPNYYNNFLQSQIIDQIRSLVWGYAKLLIAAESGDKKKLEEAKELIFSLLYLLMEESGSSTLTKEQQKALQTLIKQLSMVASLSDSFLLNRNNLSLVELLVSNIDNQIANDQPYIQKIFNSNT